MYYQDCGLMITSWRVYFLSKNMNGLCFSRQSANIYTSSCINYNLKKRSQNKTSLGRIDVFDILLKFLPVHVVACLNLFIYLLKKKEIRNPQKKKLK